MRIRSLKTIPQEEIESARWAASLPAKKHNLWTTRIYRAVANMKAHEKMKRRPVIAMRELGAIMQEAAGDAAVFKQILNAYEKVEAIPTKNNTIGRLLLSPADGIKKAKVRPVTLTFVDAVDELQKLHGRFPKRAEIIKKIGLSSFGDGECSRQISKLEWGDYI